MESAVAVMAKPAVQMVQAPLSQRRSWMWGNCERTSCIAPKIIIHSWRVMLESGLKDLLRAFMLMPGGRGAGGGDVSCRQTFRRRDWQHPRRSYILVLPGAAPSPATMPSVILLPRLAICWKATTAQDAYLPAMEWARSLYRTYRTPLCSWREASRMEAYLGRSGAQQRA